QSVLAVAREFSLGDRRIFRFGVGEGAHREPGVAAQPARPFRRPMGALEFVEMCEGGIEFAVLDQLPDHGKIEVTLAVARRRERGGLSPSRRRLNDRRLAAAQGQPEHNGRECKSHLDLSKAARTPVTAGAAMKARIAGRKNATITTVSWDDLTPMLVRALAIRCSISSSEYCRKWGTS